MHAAAWTDFLVASAGASGALAGLVFVSLSINLGKILALPGVAGRAGETLILLASALLGCLLLLIPDTSPQQLGWMLLLLWIPTWLIPSVGQVRDLRAHRFYSVSLAWVRCGLFQAATLPLLLCSLALLGCMGGGLHWFALALMASLGVALFNAWVLLVEILR